MSPRVMKVIESQVVRGTGVDHDPCREVMQYWTLDGKRMLAECDEWWERSKNVAGLGVKS